jgi:Zinc carboxypeptidase
MRIRRLILTGQGPTGQIVTAGTLMLLLTVSPEAEVAAVLAQTRPTMVAEAAGWVGHSVQGRPILFYRFGNGPRTRLLVGGIHGGYEFNTVRLMSRTVEYMHTHPAEVPADVTLFVVPNLNPDGSVAGTDRINGRLNANKVDLNRNWDYDWRAEAFHGRNLVSGGTRPFSEPETEAMRRFIADNGIEAVIFYHSAFDAVFAGVNVTRTHTLSLARQMSKVTGYKLRLDGVPGQVTTGDAIDYLSNATCVTAIEIELITRDDIEWERNLRGIRFFLRWHPPAAPGSRVASRPGSDCRVV